MANLASGGITVVGIGTNLMNVSLYLASAMAATDIGKPVSQDTPANTVKAAVDGGLILGILGSYEDRTQEGVKTGAVQMYGGYRLTYKTADAVAVGDYVISAGSGEVKKSTQPTNARVFAKNTTTQTVDVMLMPGLIAAVAI